MQDVNTLNKPPQTTGSITPPPLTPKPISTPNAPQPLSSPIPTTPTPQPMNQPVLTPSPAQPIPPGESNQMPVVPPTIKPPSGGPTPPQHSNSGSVEIKKSPFRFVGIAIVIIVVLGILGFIATKLLGGQKSNTTETVTLTYWGLWEPNQAMAGVFTAFEEAHPGVKVNYVMQSHKEYRERLQAAILRGEGPDIFRFHNTWTPMLKNELAAIPKSIMSPADFEKTFYPITQKDLKVGTNYIGIPLEFDGLALYYNQEIFKNANKTPPTTWEELRALANQLTLRDEEGRIIRGGVALGTTGNVDHWPEIVGLMMLQNAANPANPKDQLAQDSVAFYTIFTTKDKVWDATLPPSTVAFANEKVAMMIAPSWRAFDIKNLSPDLQFATVPVPQLPNTSVYWASYWAEGVSKKTSSDKQELSWQLLSFLSQPENLRTFYAAASNLRLFGEPYPRMDMASELESDPVVGAYVSTAKTAQSWWLSSWTHDNGLNDRIMKYYEDAVNAMVEKGSTPKKALDVAAEGVVQVLSQYGVSGALK